MQPSITYPELEALWRSAGSAYGIPWEVLAAINKIESNFGRNMGPSSAGAVGWMQFMPDTWLRWGTDGDGDRIADPWDPQDGVYSAARYLAAAGGMADLRRSVFAYNHAEWYVDDVLELAAVFGQGGGEATLAYDTLQQDLGGAQLAIVQASDALTAALKERKRAARDRGGPARRRRPSEALLRPPRRAEARDARGRRRTPRSRAGSTRSEACSRRRSRRSPTRAPARRAPRFAPAAGSLLGAPVLLRRLRLSGRWRRERRLGRCRPTTTTRPRTSPRPRARRSTRSRTASSRRPGATTRAAGSASRSRRPTG